jgi:hypothetical protein
VLLASSIAVMPAASAMLVGVKLGMVTGTLSSPEHLRAPPPGGCGHRRAILAPRSELARQRRHQWIVAQLVVVVDDPLNFEHPPCSRQDRAIIGRYPSPWDGGATRWESNRGQRHRLARRAAMHP